MNFGLNPVTSSIKATRQHALLAFCHIEKAAGTSLTHILRQIFFLRYASVRPLHSDSNFYFTARDLRTIRKCNPLLRAIGGHSVVPYGDLIDGSHSIRFITQLRDPVARAISQYRFWVNKKIDQSGPDAFLQHPVSHNFQVKKLAGCENLDLAIENVTNHFMLAGTVEDFDAFLVLLAQQLDMPLERFVYRKQNVDTTDRALKIPKTFKDHLRECNQLDQRLYDWVKTEFLADRVDNYAGNFPADLKKFQTLQQAVPHRTVAPIIDSVYRNAYLKPVSGLIRFLNGLPYSGSYAVE